MTRDPALPTTSVVFDLDGTLVDSVADLADAVNDVLIHLGRPPRPVAEVRTMIGHGATVLLERALGSKDPELLERARGRFKDAYLARLTAHTRPFDGVLEALEALRAAGLELAMATNKPAMFTNPLVSALGLDRVLAGFASSDEAGRRKPDPAVVHLALARAAASSSYPPGQTAGGGRPSEARRVIYVGDMPVDLETARAVPCPCLGVAWGFDPAGLAAQGPELWAETPQALVDVLTRGR